MFLEKILKSVNKRLDIKKAALPMGKIVELSTNMPQRRDFPFEKALITNDIAFICEIKKASPSKGIISHDFPYMQIAKDYVNGGAAAISVLTEPEFFLGRDEYLLDISKSVPIPTLRKDFVTDPYQIYEAKLLGASAILLIAEILEEKSIREYISIAHSLGLSALVESHSMSQMEKAIAGGARVIGVNNRNLVTFEVDINTSINLRKIAPPELIFVSESGISGAEDIALLRENKVNAVLIGERLMRSADRVKTLENLRCKK